MKFSSWSHFVQQLELRLSQTLPGFAAHLKMIPESRRGQQMLAGDDARQSGVLILLYPVGDQVHIVLIERTNDGGAHSGQIALPGGKRESFDETIVATALREAAEEVNLDAGALRILGILSPLYIPVSNFEVHPVVAVMPHQPVLEGSAFEVARILEPSLAEVFAIHKEAKVYTNAKPGQFWKAPVYQLPDETIIWGATAMILSELSDILDSLT
ncbi:CoA pyrophosphatase [Taibaiella sp. KBW10]|uniref:NUDIX hydrolase n=1 Tax=Taibaiella sp. KBW10 TaxID=2153357 RepID=UPI000F5ACE3C|nr:CoA pyrophosphatase [Taibaiella sp. KBW10]RQO31984.1 CoA pyrophosphatase [Taibaiella sp. KBW10]